MNETGKKNKKGSFMSAVKEKALEKKIERAKKQLEEPTRKKDGSVIRRKKEIRERYDNSHMPFPFK